MELISDYMRDGHKRHMLNELTRKTFGFDFEGWVTGGYFEGDYIPYSFEEDGRIISNVSANRMRFMQNGTVKNYIQIGTVMTACERRGQGLAAKLIRHVIGTYENECDGIYLFGNLGAAGFYHKAGFTVMNQYRYSVKEEFCRSDKNAEAFRPVKEMDVAVKNKYRELVRESAPHSSFEQINKFGLQMFYTAGFENVFYAEDIDCFIVTEHDGCIVLQSVLSKEIVPLTDVLMHMDLPDNKCILGFTPLEEDMDKCVGVPYDGGDDYRLFCWKDGMRSIENERLYFPELSHA